MTTIADVVIKIESVVKEDLAKVIKAGAEVATSFKTFEPALAAVLSDATAGKYDTFLADLGLLVKALEEVFPAPAPAHPGLAAPTFSLEPDPEPPTAA